jgi:hypothetical protein
MWNANFSSRVSGAVTFWNSRAGIRARAIWRTLRTVAMRARRGFAPTIALSGFSIE